MDENRLRAYLNLIQLLLSCPAGEEGELLQEHSEFVDSGLIEVMQQVASRMAADGEQNAAFLKQLAEQISQDLAEGTQGGNADRNYAYLQLIQQLLSCPSSEQPQLLQANSELIDGEFLQVCQIIAENLAGEDQENAADFLRNMASQLGQLLGMNDDGDSDNSEEENPQEYVKFILELLRAEERNDIAVIHSIISQLQHLINARFAEILRQVAANLIADKAPKIIRSILSDIENLSIDICQFPGGNRANNIEIAIAGYQIVLSNREPGNKYWARTQNNLAAAYCGRIRGEKADNIEKAIAFCTAALSVRTRDAFPKDWATTQNNLANAYCSRIRGEKADNIEVAIASFTAVLEVFTCDAFPEQWARTQNNLAIAYSERIRGEKGENIEQAIIFCTAALKVYTRDAFPEQWAMTQNNLGIAYRNRIRGERADNIEKAIAFFNAALEVRTRDAFPLDWAQTQLNLANAYRKRIRGKKADNIEVAIASYNAALEVYTRDVFPEEWATTQNNLATAYSDRIRGEKAQNIEMAIASYTAALKVRTRDAFPLDWAQTQNNLAVAYYSRIRGEKAENIELAIASYTAATEVRTRHAFPEYWAQTQNNLGLAYSDRIRGEKAENIERAIKLYHNALTIRTREAFPQNYTETLFNLGILYHSNQQWQLAYDTFSPAIETVEFLRGEIQSGDESKKKLAEEWNQLYQRMVEVCLELAKGDLQYYTKAIEYAERSKARNLVELLANKDIYPKNDFYPNSELYQTHCHQLEQVRRQIPAKQRELEILISNRESEETYRSEIEQRRQELNQLQQQRDELLAEISQIDSKFAFTQTVKTIPFSNIQSLIDENTAIIEWYITGSQILTFIITRYHPHPIVVNSEDMTALENWDKDYRHSYQKQNTQWINNLASRIQNLAGILHIDDILSSIDECFSESGAKCNRLILIPHRYLHLFPLHALPLADGKLLFERFPKGVGYAPSCQLLKQAKDQEQNRPDFTRLFAIQNPTRQPTKPLLGSQLEIDKIRQYFDLEQSIILKEAEATEANLYQRMEQMRSSHCIHFSCHGEFNHKSPLESALLLADPEGQLQDKGKLTLGEVYEKLYLNQCRLVTFSACESGMTDPNSISDEYIGLPSGFLYAGSLSVVSTLWSVDPIATTLLMVKFYHNLKRLPQIKTGDVAIALNKAQQWLRTLTYKKWARIQSYPQFQHLVEEAFENSPKRDRNKFKDSLFESLLTDRQPLPFANPYYWSAFVAIGI